jgi:hypothetical protein
MDQICATVYRQPGGAPVGRLLPDGNLEIPLLRSWIRLGWVTSDGSVFSELHPGTRRGWVIDGVGYLSGHPDHPVVLVTPSGVIRDRRGEVAGTVYPPDTLAGAALFVALSS